MQLLSILIVSLILSGTTFGEGNYTQSGVGISHKADKKKKKAGKLSPPKKKAGITRAKEISKAKRHSAKKKLVLTKTLAIMGSKYATIPILGGQLTGTVYYLASGHGGPDPGAIGTYGKKLLPEDEYAYDVTIRLARVLIQHGATVYMIVQDRNDGIRDTALLPIDYDEVAYPNLTIPLNQTKRLNQTTTAVNGRFARHKGQYQRFVTIHVDSRSRGETIDVFFYHHPESRAGLSLARHIHKKFQANYKRYQPSRPYLGRVSSRGSLYVVKNSHPPTVFIELGNIQNKQDQRRFLLAENRQALANWMYQGMLADYQTR